MAANIIETPPEPLKTKSGSVVPPSKGEIHFGTPTPATPAAPAAPKPSAKQNMAEALRAKAKNPESSMTGGSAPATPPPAPTPKAEAVSPPPPEVEDEPQPEAEEFDLGEDTKLPPKTTPKAEPKAEPVAEPKPGEPKAKVSPWKLVDEWKAKAAKAEQDLLEAKKLVTDEAARKQELEEVEKIRKRNEELEKEIHYSNYTKSKEFQQEFETKFEQPFNHAWEKLDADIKEMTVVDASGNERQATINDVTAIINLNSLTQAREAARELFGDSAGDIMDHRKTIRDLYLAREAALTEARNKGAETQKQRMEQMQRMRTELTKEITTHWQHFNGVASKDRRFGRFFTPTEGDEEGNKSLEAGFKFVDEAMAMNPLDPRLKPEERKEIVRKQSAVRNRSAAFGRMSRIIEQRDARIAELEAKMKQYEGSEPDLAGRTPATGAAVAGSSARESVFGALHKIAKPA